MALQYKQSNRQRRRRAPRASQACDPCAAAKARCDNNERCQRCQRRNISCIRPQSLGDNTSPTNRDQGRLRPFLQLPNEQSHILNGLGGRDVDALVGDWAGGHVPSSRSPEPLRHGIEHLSRNSQNTPSGFCEERQNRLLSPEEDTLMASSPAIDFAFTPFIQGTIPQTRETPGSNLENLFNSVFGLSNVTIAFERTVGHWNPDRSNHRAAEEANIYLEPAVQTTDPCFTIPRLSSSPAVVSVDTRDAILAMILNNCERDNAMRVASAFPSAELITELLLSFLESHALEEDTWIHTPTFDANQAPAELLMACVASSAIESTDSSLRRFGKALHSVLHPYLFQVFENNIIRTRQLQYIQALALFIHTGLWSGDKRKMEISEAIVGCVIQMLRCGGYYRNSAYKEITPSSEDTGGILEAKWYDWVRDESFKRIVWHMQVHCSKESLATGKRPPVACAELLLPLPRHQELWRAETASKWKEVYLGFSPQRLPRIITVRDALSKPMTLVSLPASYDSDLAQLIVLHCIFPMIRDYQQVRVLCGSEDEDMMRANILANESEHQRLLRLLQSMRMLNETQKAQRAAHRALLIEAMFMHLFAPFEQIELAAGREGEDEAKTAYLSTQIWSQRCQARQAAWNAGQVVRYLRQIPSAQFTAFHAVVAYQASLCLWMYGTIAVIGAQSPADDGPSSTSTRCLLDMGETAKIQEWINLNQGIPAICKVALGQGTHQEGQIPLSSTRDVMVCLRELLQYKVSGHGTHTLTSAVCDLMSALSTVHLGPVF